MALRVTSRCWGSLCSWHGGFSAQARAGPGFPPELCGGCPHPPVPEAAVVLGSRRVTQLLEHLSEVVEQSSLFDPQHPGLEEELESLRRRLEALSSSEPSSMETHFSNRAGSLCPACPPLPAQAGMEVPTCQAPSDVVACALPLSHVAACQAGPAVICPCVGLCHVPNAGRLL